MKKRIFDKSRKFYSSIFRTLIILSFLLIVIPGLTSAVTIIDSDPEDGAKDVSIKKWIIVRFNTTMDTKSVEKSLKITPSLDPYGYRLDWSNDDRELIIKPNSALAYSEDYTISFFGAEDEEGNSVDNPTLRFETEPSPGVWETITGVFENIWAGFLDIVPGIILLVVILIIGYIIAKAASWAFSKALMKLGFDKAMERVGVGGQLRSLGIKSTSKFLGIFVFWFIFVIVLQIAISAMGVPSISNILAPIVLFIPRILIAAIIILIGLYVANIVAKRLLDQFHKTEVGKQLKTIDKKTKTSGISIIRVVSLFIKIFILLFFVQVALEIVNIGLLSEFITPVLLIMPLVLVAMFIILVGLLVTEIIRKAILKLVKEFEIQKLIRPVEKTIGRRGVILGAFIFVIRVLVMLIFIQLAIGVLNSTGAFNQLAALINEVILWMPNVLAALVIILIGFWFAGWAYRKVLFSARKMDMPFPEATATTIKLVVVFLAGIMAIAQIGFKVVILYIVTAIVLGAIFIGLGAGFAIGTKEIFANVGGYIQNNRTLKVGKRITVDGKYSGKIQKIGHHTTTILADNGEKIIIPNSQLVRSVIVESPS